MSATVIPRQRDLLLLRYIHGYQLAHGGVSPTMRECAKALGISRGSNVFKLMNRLQHAGMIRRLPNKVRAIEILEPPAIPTIAGSPLYFVTLPGR